MQIDVRVVDETTMKFKVLNPMMRARILRRGMWNIGNIPMVVKEWMPDELKEKPEVTAIPLWVHLKNVPMNMYSWQGLSFITSAVGVPDHLHPETAACSNFKLAKVFVVADLTKELPSKINFTKDGRTSLVEFSYPWLPPRCNACGKWGHLEKVCVINKKDGSEKSVKEIIKADVQDKEKREKEDMVRKAGSESKKRSSVSGDKHGPEVVEASNEVEEGELIENWATITPGKGRSPTLQFGQVKILTPSRYSALLKVDEKGDAINPIEIEEILSIEEEVVVEKDEEIIRLNEESQEKVIEMEKITEAEGDKQTVKSIAGIEHWPDLASNTLRPSLPRKSKTQHKFISEKSTKRDTPGKAGKGDNNINSPQ